MTSPLLSSERKACFGCSRAKRTCNKGVPSCQRCMAKKLDCQYSPSRRFFRARSAAPRRHNDVEGEDVLSLHVLIPQSPRETPPRDAPVTETTLDGQHIAKLATPASSTSPPGGFKPWFLELGTWAIDDIGDNPCRFSPGPVNVSLGHQSWTANVWNWLHQWIETGGNPFIHPQLYFDTGLPQCLQDAWATLTAYFSKTAQNAHIVMGILEERMNHLLRASTSLMTTPRLQTIDYLARTQALFIYHYLCLYDGSIRQRALAENNMLILLTWCQQLWQSATFDAYLESVAQETPEDNLPGHSDQGATMRHWKAWTLTESVRRTWLVCTSTLAAYFRQRDGFNQCTGEIRFTASKSLWEATSLATWARLASGKGPLFVHSLHVDELLSTARYTDVDDFTTTYMTLLMGTEKVRSWAASS